MRRVFLLSPASTSGERARILLRDEARFPLAVRVREEGAPIGDVFAFLSGLYFRGKLTYARAFAMGEDSLARVITSTRGLLPLGAIVTRDDLREFAEVDIHHESARFTKPLLRDAKKVRTAIGSEGQVILLGSIASKKYVTALTEIFGERLVFPIDFVGRGDMSRGGLLLRAARAGEELAYAPVLGTQRRGARPPKLAPVRGILKSVTPKD